MEKVPPKNLILLNPSEYFHALIEGAVESLKVDVTEHARVYLVNLLSHFISSENLFPPNAEGKPEDPALALQLASALEAESAEERRARLRKLGDFSLYIAGYFSHSLDRKLVDVDYYIDMGGSAYLEAANIPGRRAPLDVFRELGKRFPDMVDVLGQVSEESFIHQHRENDDKSLLRIYDLWAKTGSERLAKQLAKAGIQADLNIKKTKQ